jgi:predicted solute-binding protein
MYVSQLTIDMGASGRKGLEELFDRGRAAGLIPAVPDLQLV